jgi:hypothetical protein
VLFGGEAESKRQIPQSVNRGRIKGYQRILASVIFGSSLWYRAKSIKALTALTQIETDISRCKQTA